MKKGKKIFLICSALLIVIITAFILWYFLPKTFLGNVDSADIEYISVFDGSTGEKFDIVKSEEIAFIADNISNIKMKKDKISVGYSGFSFRMTFYGKNGKIIDSFIINGESTIRDDPFFYRCEGGLCFDFLKELEEKYTD